MQVYLARCPQCSDKKYNICKKSFSTNRFYGRMTEMLGNIRTGILLRGRMKYQRRYCIHLQYLLFETADLLYLKENHRYEMEEIQIGDDDRG